MKLISKNKFVVIFIITIICVSSMISITKIYNKTQEKTVLIGNYIDISQNVDISFTSTFMTSSYLYKLLLNDSIKMIDNKKTQISDLIKKSNNIIINIGSYEIGCLIKIEHNNFLYDTDILNRQLEILIENIDNIYSLITIINKKTKIILCDITYPFTMNDNTLIKFYKTTNDEIYNLAVSHNIKYISKQKISLT